jgi:hypothetical protein
MLIGSALRVRLVLARWRVVDALSMQVDVLLASPLRMLLHQAMLYSRYHSVALSSFFPLG